uniref:Malic_M domain-containing protein n=1 Tax=Panagrellus redivivus TaxID=6233 RepID=A0A7E4V4K6_PANRE
MRCLTQSIPSLFSLPTAFPTPRLLNHDEIQHITGIQIRKPVYMKVVELNFITDSDVRATAAAAVYKASQASDSPKTMLEIGEAVSVLEGDILEASEKLLLVPSFM